ncbi:MAG: arylsulfatase [Bryobacterales bacterium]|nr:arylsulfatase [Bryobacterales bacterium]
MTRRDILGTLAAATGTATAAAAAAPRPNIVLIIADDLGYANLGCYGQKRIRTPHLDQLAAEGLRFTDAYAGSTVCAPSRCALMTGLHTGHARTRGNKLPDLPLRPEDITVTELVKRAGYRTGLFGKWSLGNIGSTGHPRRKGFDEWFGFFNQNHAHTYYPDALIDNDTVFMLSDNLGKPRQYAHDIIAERGLAFLKKKDTRPFFVKFAFTIPHANNELGRDTGNGMEVPSTEPYTGEAWPEPDKCFAAMVTRLDQTVGQIMAALRETGQDQNTLVIFTSDNGPHREGGHNPDFFDDNGPLRGIKRDLYEGGIRVPFLARWPARVKPGGETAQPIAFWDFLPTVCELAGVAIPPRLDGISYAPTLLGTGGQRQHPYLYWEFHERRFAQAVRAGEWKAVRLNPGVPLELYNLKDDLGEKRNVAAEHPDLVARMEKILAGARVESADWPRPSA